MVRRARTIDHVVWALVHDERLSLGKARRRVAKEHRLHLDHIRKLQRLALIVYADDIAEAELEKQLIDDGMQQLAQEHTE